MTAREHAYREGLSSFMAGLPLVACPSFIREDLSVSWVSGWHDAKAKQEERAAFEALAKFKRWLNARFPNHMAVLELKLKEKL